MMEFFLAVLENPNSHPMAKNRTKHDTLGACCLSFFFSETHLQGWFRHIKIVEPGPMTTVKTEERTFSFGEMTCWGHDCALKYISNNSSFNLIRWITSGTKNTPAHIPIRTPAAGRWDRLIGGRPLSVESGRGHLLGRKEQEGLML